jgi:uncharacterized protein
MNIFKKTLIEVVVVFAVLIVLLLILNYFVDEQEETIVIVNAQLAGQDIVLEVADNPFSRAIGLSKREHLQENHGMIFIYDDEVEELSFWMKDTLIPLDMLFLNKELEIVRIFENVAICEEDPCPLYTYDGLALYVIELNAGWVGKYDVKEGDILELKTPDLSDS